MHLGLVYPLGPIGKIAGERGSVGLSKVQGPELPAEPQGHTDH